jgi:hypothetical protein
VRCSIDHVRTVWSQDRQTSDQCRGGLTTLSSSAEVMSRSGESGFGFQAWGKEMLPASVWRHVGHPHPRTLPSVWNHRIRLGVEAPCTDRPSCCSRRLFGLRRTHPLRSFPCLLSPKAFASPSTRAMESTATRGTSAVTVKAKRMRRWPNHERSHIV